MEVEVLEDLRVLGGAGKVCWTQTMENMIAAGVNQVIEVGPGTVLQGLFRRLNPNIELSSAAIA